MSKLRVLSASLDLQARPGAGQAVIARLPVGTQVAEIAGPDALGWAKLKRIEDGLVGWAYVCVLGPAEVPADRRTDYEVAVASLELRTGPGTNYPVLATMPKGTLVEERIEPVGGWAEVSRRDTGELGWSCVEYLMPAPKPAAAPAVASSATQAPAPATPVATAAAHPPAAASPPAGPAATAQSTAQAADSPRPQPGAASPAPADCCYRPSQQVLDSGGSPIVFDVSHFQGKVDAGSAHAEGLRGMLHKATEGTVFVDPMYAHNRAGAKSAGMLWGAYHFGVGGDAKGQAQYFLEHAAPDGSTLLVLDFEHNPQGASMTLAEAREFVTYLHARTGKWPGVYGGSYLRELLGDTRDAVLGNCWFWLADYTDHVRSVPPTWDYWTLWQYTDGHAGPAPHAVSGVPGGRCDRDRFVGDADALALFWSACGV